VRAVLKSPLRSLLIVVIAPLSTVKWPACISEKSFILNSQRISCATTSSKWSFAGCDFTEQNVPCPCSFITGVSSPAGFFARSEDIAIHRLLLVCTQASHDLRHSQQSTCIAISPLCLKKLARSTQASDE
jgi:hypothetical protein